VALTAELDPVRAVRLDQPGRGRALRSAWSASDAGVLAYMDVDLSTDLNALLPLVAPLLSGHSDVAIGTRLAPGARVIRGRRREVISRCYNLLLHATLRAGFSDAQCGFKAIRADQARRLLPLTQDAGWFLDTELLVLAERAGLRIHEVPVDWTDDSDSRVDVVATALADLRGIARLGRRPLGQLARFAGSAAPLQLAGGEPVMAIGGFNGTDPTPTLAQFERYAADHEIHYFVGANGDSFGGGSGDAAQITAWVKAHFTAKTVGGETVYDLTARAG